MTSAAEIFFGTSGPHDAKIAIVGEAFGADEDRAKLPFVGYTGKELSAILAECGIARNTCFITNVVSERPPQNDMKQFFHCTQEARKADYPLVRGLYPKQNVRRGIELLRQQLEIVQPEVVIGFGNYALWALTDNSFSIGNDKGRKVPTGIIAWRGSQLYCRDEMGGFPLLPTIHPAAIFKTWTYRYDIVHDLRSRLPKALRGEWSPPPYNFLVRPSFEQTMDELSKLQKRSGLIVNDLETFGGHITCTGFAWSTLDAICIPFICFDGGSVQSYFSEDEEIAIRFELRKIYANPEIKIVGQNFLYDAQYIASEMFVIPHCHLDTMILQHLCWPDRPKSLNYISSLYNNYYSFWKEEGKEHHPTFSDEQHWSYNAKDCVNTFEAAQHLQSLVQTFGLQQQAEWQMEQFDLCLDMMLYGVRVDQETKRQLSLDLLQLINQHRNWLENIIPEDVYPRKKKASPWYTSPKQQAELFYDTLHIAEVHRHRTTSRTMNDEALTIISKREPILQPICEALQELRSLRVFRKNFLEASLDSDGRMRCTFSPTGTKAFGWSSSENAFGRGTNLQNIPAGTEE